MPLVSDFADVLQELANADLLPVHLLRAGKPTLVKGVASGGGYVDLGPLPEGETAVVPVELETYAERDDLLPAGERARARIVVYTTRQIRAGRGPDEKADRVRTPDGRTWRAVHCEDWSASGNFYVAECDLIDADPVPIPP